MGEDLVLRRRVASCWLVAQKLEGEGAALARRGLGIRATGMSALALGSWEFGCGDQRQAGTELAIFSHGNGACCVMSTKGIGH